MPAGRLSVQTVAGRFVEYRRSRLVYPGTSFSGSSVSARLSAEVVPLADRPPGSAGRRRAGRAAEAPADAQLLGRVAQGDTGAFDSLFRRYRPRLRRYLDRRTRRPELVDEIV